MTSTEGSTPSGGASRARHRSEVSRPRGCSRTGRPRQAGASGPLEPPAAPAATRWPAAHRARAHPRPRRPRRLLGVAVPYLWGAVVVRRRRRRRDQQRPPSTRSCRRPHSDTGVAPRSHVDHLPLTTVWLVSLAGTPGCWLLVRPHRRRPPRPAHRHGDLAPARARHRTNLRPGCMARCGPAMATPRTA
jgi:hypothetical protein